MAAARNGRGAFLVLEGVDGSGKSTIGRAVEATMTDVPVVYTSHKEIPTHPPEVEQSMRELAAVLWPKDQRHLAGLPSEYRVLLHAAWFSIFSECVIKPRVAAGAVMIVDGWYYKIMARLRVDGYDQHYLDVIFSRAAEPDEVILLDPPVAEVWARKEAGGRGFGPVEMGLYAGYKELGRDSFIDYQSRTRDAIKAVAEERQRRLVVVRDVSSVEHTLSSVTSVIREYLQGTRCG